MSKTAAALVMENIEIAVAALLRSIVAIGVPGERIFVLYVFSTLAIVYFVYRFRKPRRCVSQILFPQKTSICTLLQSRITSITSGWHY
jgi:hypothetical protein